MSASLFSPGRGAPKYLVWLAELSTVLTAFFPLAAQLLSGTHQYQFLGSLQAHRSNILIAWWAVPSVCALLVLWRRIVRRIDFGICPPRPGWRGRESLRLILKRISVNAGFKPETAWRLTIFVPDSQTDTLVQVARLHENLTEKVSQTAIRMGTCTVGHVYNRMEPWYIPNVDECGGFREVLKWCGMTDSEIGVQGLSDRKCFAAYPVLTTDQATSKVQVLAVVAVDAAKPNCLPDKLFETIQKEARDIQRALRPKVLSHPPAMTPALSEAPAKMFRESTPPSPVPVAHLTAQVDKPS